MIVLYFVFALYSNKGSPWDDMETILEIIKHEPSIENELCELILTIQIFTKIMNCNWERSLLLLEKHFNKSKPYHDYLKGL